MQEQFFAVLARLRLGLKVEDVCTGLAPSTFSKMFATWVVFLALELPHLLPWPSRKVIDVTMPACFAKYPSTRVIIDCMEMQVQQPSSLLQQSVTYSQYKRRNTFKVLVGISLRGLVTFLSPLWGGRVSDREITAQLRLVKDDKMLEEGDSVMADRGFDVEDILARKKVRLTVLPRLDGRPRLPEKDVEKTWRIAEVRIHVERSIGRARRYDILNSPIPLTISPIADEIVSVCFLLTNFDKPLVQK